MFKVTVDVELVGYIPKFIENQKNHILRMARAIAEDDLETVRKINHCVKGVAKSFGFLALDTLSDELSRSYGNPDSAKSIVMGMDRYINSVVVISDDKS